MREGRLCSRGLDLFYQLLIALEIRSPEGRSPEGHPKPEAPKSENPATPPFSDFGFRISFGPSAFGFRISGRSADCRERFDLEPKEV